MINTKIITKHIFERCRLEARTEPPGTLKIPGLYTRSSHVSSDIVHVIVLRCTLRNNVYGLVLPRTKPDFIK